MKYYDAVVVGGGFFGAEIAVHLRKYMNRILLVEAGPSLMKRASYGNQARVHNGYHYPRSILTALRSHINFPRFIEDYAPSIVKNTQSYYAIPRRNSKVTAEQFFLFMKQVGAPIEEASPQVTALFDQDMIEGVFKTEEYSFDAQLLLDLVLRKLQQGEIEVRTHTLATHVKQGMNNTLTLSLNGNEEEVRAGMVFNCTYSMINFLLTRSQLPIIPLKHELTEMILLTPPPELDGKAFTVMCGPFFSLMPFPPLQQYCFSHVRYTPHHEWHDQEGVPYMNSYDYFSSHHFRTRGAHMIQDGQRYLPSLAKSQISQNSIWEVKTLLPQSELSDSRPILFATHHGLQNLHCILGGKIDNIYDIKTEIDMLFAPTYPTL